MTERSRGSIALARSLCVEVAGEPDEDDIDGNAYGSVDVAEILSGEMVRLRAERDALLSLLRRWRDEYGGSTIRGKPVNAALDAETDAVLDAAVYTPR